ncbi:MAG: NAD(+) diphosphatase [Lachnospiraceae bacterium]|nr:NAD(+) diphosphatase [Lachnospiraceae bacterium]
MIQDIYPHIMYNQFRPGKSPADSDTVLYFKGNELMVRIEGDEIAYPKKKELPGITDFLYLFCIDEEDYYLARPGDEVCPEGYQFLPLRQLRRQASGPRDRIFAAYTALQLNGWYNDNVFCGRCGSRTEHSVAERAMVCPSCGRVIYPRIVPAVIVAVRNGDEILLTKYAGRGLGFYALVAGFTEIGETLEETVQREVMEEVGLHVKNIHYYKSQPWGIADDILMGFYCDVDGDTTIRLDTTELKVGEWVRRENVELQPDDFSLTNEMMKNFKEGIDP